MTRRVPRTDGGFDTAMLDWGIGGLGVYNELHRREPGRRILYISDAGATPYGELASRALALRVLEIAAWLGERGIGRLVVACNAASTVLRAIQPRLDALGIEATGVIEHGIALAVASGARSVAIIGGARTIRSGMHRRALADAGIAATGRIAQPLSAAVESGDLTSRHTAALVERVVAPLRSHEALLLACTHYPALIDHFRRAMPGALILDPAAATAAHVIRAWPSRSEGAAGDLFVTTGEIVQMRRSARLAFAAVIAPSQVAIAPTT